MYLASPVTVIFCGHDSEEGFSNAHGCMWISLQDLVTGKVTHGEHKGAPRNFWESNARTWEKEQGRREKGGTRGKQKSFVINLHPLKTERGHAKTPLADQQIKRDLGSIGVNAIKEDDDKVVQKESSITGEGDPRACIFQQYESSLPFAG